MRCRCGPRRQVAIIRSPSLLYIVVTQLSLLKIFVIYYMLHDHAPKRMIITQGVFLLVPKSHFCVLELKQL